MQALIVNPEDHPLPEGSADVLHGIGWHIITADDYETAADALRDRQIDAVLMPGPVEDGRERSANGAFADLLCVLDSKHVAGIVVSDRAARRRPRARSLIDVVDRSVSPAEIRGRFAMIERYHAQFKRMEREMRHMERIGQRLDEHFREVNEEMRLAARLQRDFLPRTDAPIGNVRFATLFRPASWVSGDTFDIFRIDERFTGFYVVDAVGHGMAASLLTMFIRRAIVPKKVSGDSYTIVSPSEAMTALNKALVDQSLPNCQFVTACYALFDHQDLTLHHARGGHPYPLKFDGDGSVRELNSAGGLLGVLAEQDFTTVETPLTPGDKILIYTDGIELAFQANENCTEQLRAFKRACAEHAHLPIERLVSQLEIRLDAEAGSLHPQDDVTIVGLEVLPG